MPLPPLCAFMACYSMTLTFNVTFTYLLVSLNYSHYGPTFGKFGLTEEYILRVQVTKPYFYLTWTDDLQSITMLPSVQVLSLCKFLWTTCKVNYVFKDLNLPKLYSYKSSVHRAQERVSSPLHGLISSVYENDRRFSVTARHMKQRHPPCVQNVALQTVTADGTYR
jgi:hypothetical protein